MHPALQSSAGYTRLEQKRLLPIWFWPWFWRTFLVVSLGYAWYCFYVPANNVSWARDLETGKAQATNSGKPMLLFFTGEWCVPCRIMKRQVWADPQVEETVSQGFVPVMIYADSPEAVAAFTEYGIRVTPTTVVVDALGRELRRAEGGIGKEAFFQLIQPELH